MLWQALTFRAFCFVGSSILTKISHWALSTVALLFQSVVGALWTGYWLTRTLGAVTPHRAGATSGRDIWWSGWVGSACTVETSFTESWKESIICVITARFQLGIWRSGQVLIFSLDRRESLFSHTYSCDIDLAHVRRKEGSALFKDTLNTFYLQLYDIW